MDLSTNALIKRINRKLASDWRRVCTARVGSRLESGVGRYYVLNTHRNDVVDTHVQLETLGRELGLLRDCERVIG